LENSSEMIRVAIEAPNFGSISAQPLIMVEKV
jgi:hypothetical protein